MIRIKSRERGIYVERFDNGFWHLETIKDSFDDALLFVRVHFGIKEAERVQLQSEGKGIDSKTG